MLTIRNDADQVQCEVFLNQTGIAVRFRDCDSGNAFDEMRIFEHYEDAINYALDCVNAKYAIHMETETETV